MYVNTRHVLVYKNQFRPKPVLRPGPSGGLETLFQKTSQLKGELPAITYSV